MEIYSQQDAQWSDKTLGTSGLNAKFWGCTVTEVAQALKVAGYPVDPGQLIDGLNNNGGFTDQGLLIWSKVSELYPQFHFGGTGYTFVQGLWGKFQHWVLKTADGQVFDPFYGRAEAPQGFVETGQTRTASIDPVPAPVEAPEAPVASEWPKVVTVTTPELFVRSEATSGSPAAISEHCPHGYLVKGDQFTAVGVVTGETVQYPGGQPDSQWLQSQFGHFVWAGGTDFTS